MTTSRPLNIRGRTGLLSSPRGLRRRWRADELARSRTPIRPHATGWVGVITLSAFGPYLSSTIGVRTEQPVFFVTSFLLLPILVISPLPSRTAIALYCLSGVFVVGAGSAFVGTNLADPNFPSGSLLAGIVNNLLPIAGIMIATAWLEHGYSRETIFRAVGTVLVWVLSINAAISIAQTRTDLTSILRHFWQASATVDLTNSVALRSISNGRNTGIFDQPAQAGFLYSIALLMAVYLWSGSYLPGRKRSVLPATLIIAGGFLTVSKIFIFLAFPLFLLSAFLKATGRARQTVKMIAWASAAVAAFKITNTKNVFPGHVQLSHYFARPNQGGGVVGLFTAGRLGSGGSLGYLFHLILKVSPVDGVGLGGTSGPVDSTWTAVAVTAGLIGIFLYALLALALMAGQLRMRDSDPTRGVGPSLLLLTLVATVGFPVFTGNRISGILWILLTVLFLSDQPWTGRSAPARSTRTPR